MPIKINNIETIVVRKRSKAKLFKREKMLNRTHIDYNGNNIIRDSHFNPLQVFMLKILDKFNPLITKYPKFGERLMSITEKLIKNADDLK